MTTDIREDAYSNNADMPLDPDRWADAAREVLSQEALDYVLGGAGSERTMTGNRIAFDGWRLAPRMAAAPGDRRPATTVLDTPSPQPWWLAPVGVQGILHERGDLETARAAHATDTPMVISTLSSFSLEEIVGELCGTPSWFQLYPVADDDVAASLVSRAEQAGCAGIVVTLDSPTIGWRRRDLASAFLPFLEGLGIANFLTDPVFRRRHQLESDDAVAGGRALISSFPDHRLDWARLSRLRAASPLPWIAKGILRGDDARSALAAGFDGIVVSNHGGRQVDGSVASLDALVEVREAVGGGVPVLLDGAVRSAPEVLKALALGADGVLLGRPWPLALAARGQAGVEHVLHTIAGDLDVTLALCGHSSPHDMSLEDLRKVPYV